MKTIWAKGVLVVATLGISAAAALLVRAQDGASLYKTKCAACHGADGQGQTAFGKRNKMRDLGSAEVQKQSDAELTSLIEAGKGKMPAYGKSLKLEQVKQLVEYIRSFAKS